jgi:hypothetical protein
MSALGSFSNTLDAAGGSFFPLPSYAAYPEGIKVQMTVTGRISVTSKPQAQYFHKDVSAGPGGVYISGGNHECAVAVIIFYGDAHFGPGVCNPPANPPGSIGYDTSGTMSVTTVVFGSGTAQRTGNIPWDQPHACDSIPDCHTYTGSQTVTIVPVAGDLDLQALYALEARTVKKALFVHAFTNAEIYAHQRVTFTDSTLPRGLPMKSLSHTWTRADPDAPNGFWNHTQVPAACQGSTPAASCPVEIRETGIWTSEVRVNGPVHTDDITLYCAESEPLLNNDLVRQFMLAALDSSHASNPSQAQRVERAFLIVQDTSLRGQNRTLCSFHRARMTTSARANLSYQYPQICPEILESLLGDTIIQASPISVSPVGIRMGAFLSARHQTGPLLRIGSLRTV